MMGFGEMDNWFPITDSRFIFQFHAEVDKSNNRNFFHHAKSVDRFTCLFISSIFEKYLFFLFI